MDDPRHVDAACGADEEGNTVMDSEHIEGLLLQALDDLAPLAVDFDAGFARARICEALRQIATPGADPITPFIGLLDAPEYPEITSTLFNEQDGDRVSDLAGCIWERREGLWHPSKPNRGEPRTREELLSRYSRVAPLR
ncbi:MAG: hypothetical protein ACK5LO_10145 [Leucobacter sp.]